MFWFWIKEHGLGIWIRGRRACAPIVPPPSHPLTKKRWNEKIFMRFWLWRVPNISWHNHFQSIPFTNLFYKTFYQDQKIFTSKLLSTLKFFQTFDQNFTICLGSYQETKCLQIFSLFHKYLHANLQETICLQIFSLFHKYLHANYQETACFQIFINKFNKQ